MELQILKDYVAVTMDRLSRELLMVGPMIRVEVVNMTSFWFWNDYVGNSGDIRCSQSIQSLAMGFQVKTDPQKINQRVGLYCALQRLAHRDPQVKFVMLAPNETLQKAPRDRDAVTVTENVAVAHRFLSCNDYNKTCMWVYLGEDKETLVRVHSFLIERFFKTV